MAEGRLQMPEELINYGLREDCSMRSDARRVDKSWPESMCAVVINIGMSLDTLLTKSNK